MLFGTKVDDSDFYEVTRSVFSFGQKWIFKLVDGDRLAEWLEESQVILKQELSNTILVIGLHHKLQ